jgi:CheY-like chemotaxis protein
MTVMADPGQIEQVLMNLATNARDAMPGGGRLVIETMRVELDVEFIRAHGYGKTGAYALITVTDTGTGMDETTKDKIFEPFFTTKGVGKGTGLGLSMSYGIIKQHEGFINVESQPGEGTSFNIYLPLIDAEIEEEETKVRNQIEKVSETILLAEDDADVRTLTKEILKLSGYKVIEAVNGEDAINQFFINKDIIQLCLLDVIMPGRNGIEAYRRMRDLSPDIKVLFISGYTADSIHRKDIVEEGLRFILKPISPTALLKSIREVLSADMAKTPPPQE